MEFFKKTDLEEKTVSSEKVYNGNFLKVYKDEVKLPNGHTAGREYIKHVGAACVVALTHDNKVIIERQYRYPVGTVVTKIPAGKRSDKNEDPLDAVKRELAEETGITADTYEYLGPLYPACAYSDEVIHMYLAKALHYGERKLDDDEFLNVDMIPIDELVGLIQDGKIADAKTQAAVMRVWAMIR